MHDTETRALKRAMILLVLVSTVRWVWTRAPDRSEGQAESVLPTLTEAVRAASEDGERRARPLAPDERVDPNRAPAPDLDRLPGIGPATAAAIVAAREAGTVFRRPQDLGAVPGVGPALVTQITPLLDLSAPPAPRRAHGSTVDTPVRVDLNRAGAAELVTLPGIGPSLADRILAARRARPFRTVDDLRDVRGIGPATLERLRALVTVGSAP